jgi:hypothetical protein
MRSRLSKLARFACLAGPLLVSLSASGGEVPKKEVRPGYVDSGISKADPVPYNHKEPFDSAALGGTPFEKRPLALSSDPNLHYSLSSSEPVSAQPVILTAALPESADRLNPSQTPTIPFQMGPITLHLPAEFAKQARITSNSKSAYMSLYLLLPDLELRSASNESDFESPAWGRKLLITLEYPVTFKRSHDLLYGYDGWIARDHPFFPFVETETEVTGFHKFLNKLGWHIYVPQHEDYAIACKGFGLAPYPHCESPQRMLDSLNLDYFYSADLGRVDGIPAMPF